mgnify:CR=1 FL=1
MGLKEPYVGITELIDGDIVNSIVRYYANSEQIPTVLSTGMLFDENGDVKCSGGYIIQLMPDATQEVIQKIENAIANAPSISKMLEDGYDLVKIAKTITGDNDIMMMLGTIENEYLCDCSRERMERAIFSMGKEAIEELAEDEITEVSCHFCNTKYQFEKSEIQKLIAEKE